MIDLIFSSRALDPINRLTDEQKDALKSFFKNLTEDNLRQSALRYMDGNLYIAAVAGLLIFIIKRESQYIVERISFGDVPVARRPR